ncbi:succinate dehydrogenase iron-sulfur subunit [Desulforamulus hydrothermalis]|uniref:succinate dehydrogenase n=1 Tax=Desulforamulus hydrothermalis Lam5 = DSM 18033 TaxID=1121428 RepID=K8DX80_9FIRM|nr:succinate dehydrogenase iron-sulfur subunit [Desulforamulus hydrothermalis]CCO07065.1 Succinate dehydrogenase iron-sulfur subunit [Desulforamulus hydrothermalis Lam5 = DSM 18033]SHH40522.1 succinate dehydrogenase subunit B [Desulforamulus hydrothermalis Lam5 = DSM 18033]
MSENYVLLKIKRQPDPHRSPYWEEFKIPYKEKMNVISLLMEIQKNPVNARGESTTPVVWECNCLEEVCGACTMVINGIARQACSTLVDQLAQPIVLEPLSKFPVIRDLMVDRTVMFENLKKVKAWIPIDGTHDLGPGPRMAQKVQEECYPISRCMTCGCCMEACPNVNNKSKFMGPAPLAQVKLFNSHPTGAMNQEERLDAIMGVGGITDCGNAQNCVKVCPKQIPLTKTIAQLNRDTTLRGIKRWLGR